MTMKNNLPFFVYSPDHSSLHILFHRHRSWWAVVNDSGLEIAKCLAGGGSADEAASALVDRYGISPAQANADVQGFFKGLRGNKILSETGLSKRIPVLNSIYFHLTNRCNLSCAHCYLSCPDIGNSKELPLSVVKRCIDELRACGGRSVTFSGGEPLMHKDIKEILSYAAVKGLGIRLLTNGTLIDREWAAFLSDMDIFIQVSLDGSMPDIHDSVRGKGSFKRALRAIEFLQDAGLTERLNISTSVMSKNIHDLRNIISLAQGLDIPLVRFLPLRRRGSAEVMWETIGSGVDIEDYEGFYREIADIQRECELPVNVSCGLSGFVLKISGDISEDDIWCPVGRRLVVDFNGDAYSCVLLMDKEFRLGNVFNHALSTIINSEGMSNICDMLTERRFKIDVCTSCNFRNLCQAGCMGQALDNKGSIWAVDDFCKYRKGAYKSAFDSILSRLENGDAKSATNL